MRTRSPSSYGSFRLRLSLIDAGCAVLAPLLALLVRDATVFSYQALWTTGPYWLLSVIFSLTAFSVFRLHDALPRYFSVNDTLDVAKAVAAAEVMTCVVLFATTRLEDIPRSTPIIHALILAVGLIASRTYAGMSDTARCASKLQSSFAIERIIVIGAGRFTSLYIRFLDACFPGEHQVIAVLDGDPRLFGRAIAGVPIVGPPHQLDSIIEEFAVHGIDATRVIVGDLRDGGLLSQQALATIEGICRRRGIGVDFVAELIGLGAPLLEPSSGTPNPTEIAEPSPALPRYFRFKRSIDVFTSLALMPLWLPPMVAAAALALLDVGSPILFWQQRLGRHGRPFLLQKIRTLRPPFDWRSQPLPDEQRLSWIGRLLRASRLDELPQLLNVLVGDMSLIGPRPLLPHDQPADPSLRLRIRPGITGWAQVHGGKLLTPAEKRELDEWYIHNASLWLDVRILVLTLRVMIAGERRCEKTLEQAREPYERTDRARRARMHRPRPVAPAHSSRGRPDKIRADMR